MIRQKICDIMKENLIYEPDLLITEPSRAQLINFNSEVLKNHRMSTEMSSPSQGQHILTPKFKNINVA